MAPIIAASARNNGYRRKKPGKLVFLITILTLLMVIVPLVIILGGLA
jgi:hypothetical protein